MAADMTLSRILEQRQDNLLSAWVAEQLPIVRHYGVKEAQLKAECQTFLRLLEVALRTGADTNADAWASMRDFLSEVSRERGERGFTPSETATFIFSFKRPLFESLKETGTGSATLGEQIWQATEILDALGLHTVEAYQTVREGVISRQQQEMLELSTPVVTLAKNILALPLIGTLDSSRTQIVMESLLQRIVETGSTIAIIDITGVPTVDTLVAQHLLKTVTAARLMGAECIISGIRPQIAQTIVHLGVELGDVVTKANLADAFRIALKKVGLAIVRDPGTRDASRIADQRLA